jgi:hypothetical protein
MKIQLCDIPARGGRRGEARRGAAGRRGAALRDAARAEEQERASGRGAPLLPGAGTPPQGRAHGSQRYPKLFLIPEAHTGWHQRAQGRSWGGLLPGAEGM